MDFIWPIFHLPDAAELRLLPDLLLRPERELLDLTLEALMVKMTEIFLKGLFKLPSLYTSFLTEN